MRRIRELMKKYIELFFSGLGICIILCFVYFVKGIYPFGNRNISYYDMSQSLVPLYYYTYDVLHGTRDAIWNWYSSAGIPMVDTIGYLLCSPFNIIFFFVQRSNILNVMSILLLIKLAVCAMAMSFYSKRTFCSLDKVWHVLFGILYASNGFVLQYYSNIQFLDIVALFPLIMFFLERMYRDHKVFGYIICMAVGFINNIYLMSMVCMFIVFYTMYHVLSDKKGRTTSISLVAVSSLIAAFLSSVFWVPTVYQLLHSTRMEATEENPFLEIFSIFLNSGINQKRFMLYGCEIAFACFFAFIIKRKSLRTNQGKYIFLFLLLILPIYYELVNSRWHVGGYVQFPMRFGYMLSFVCICLCGRLIIELRINENGTNHSKLQNVFEIVGMALIPFCSLILFSYMSGFLDYGIRDDSAYLGYWQYVGIIVIAFLFILFISDKKIRVALAGLLIVIECGLGWYGFLSPVYETLPECTDDVIVKSEELREVFWLDESDTARSLNRVKDSTVTLNSNYPYILQKAALSNWTLGTNNGLLTLFHALGYGNAYTRIIDCGGTLFSDAFLHVTDVLSMEEKDPRVFEKKDSSNEYILYSSLCYPFGILIDDYLSIQNLEVEESGLVNQGKLSEALGLSSSMWQLLRLNECIEEDTTDTVYETEFQIDAEGLIELYVESISDNQFMFEVNQKPISIPDIANPTNMIYPAYFNNGIIDLGTFEDETICIRVISKEPLNQDDLVFSLLDINILLDSIEQQNQAEREYSVSNRSLKYEIVSDKEQWLLLPIGYRKGLQVTVNGEKTAYTDIMNESFIALKLGTGRTTISISYVPPGMLLGLVLTCIGIVCFIVLLRFCSKIVGIPFLRMISVLTFWVLVVFLTVYIIVIPMGKTLYLMSLYH